MDKYGLPYQGSKNKIAPWVLEHLPKAHTLVDLFAGGCAVTHCALQSGKYEELIANDITNSVTLFQDALEGNLEKYEPDRFRTREDFFAEKDSNPFVRIIYSFGNNQRGYLYSREIEPYKKAVHEMLYAPTVNERRLKFKAVIREMEKLGLLTREGGQDRFRCKSAERAESITPPPTISKRQSGGGSEAKDWLGQYERLQTHERTEQVKGVTK